MSFTQKAVLFSVVFFSFCFGQATAQVRIAPEEAERLAIEKPTAVYPANARALGAKGVVRVEVIVSEQGMVTSAKATSGHPFLRRAAVDAVKLRKYKPHTVEGKPTPFVTDVFIGIPDGTPVTSPIEYEEQEQVAERYFAEEKRCRDLVKRQKWDEAEKVCMVVVRTADKLSKERSLEKMGAYQMYGYALMGLNRPQEALTYYSRALEAVHVRLEQKGAELARLYGDIAIAHHALRDLDKARAMYRKSAETYQLAITDIDDEEFAKHYRASLKKLLEYHLIAAEQAGATVEMEEIKKTIKSIP